MNLVDPTGLQADGSETGGETVIYVYGCRSQGTCESAPNPDYIGSTSPINDFLSQRIAADGGGSRFNPYDVDTRAWTSIWGEAQPSRVDYSRAPTFQTFVEPFLGWVSTANAPTYETINQPRLSYTDFAIAVVLTFGAEAKAIGTTILEREVATAARGARLAAEGAGAGRLLPTLSNLGDDAAGTVIGELSAGRGGYSVGGQLAEGSFDFVVQEGRVIVGRGHATLAGGGRVTYAGEATFRGGQIVEWTNASGHFRPGAAFAGNAGLPMGAFRPVQFPGFVGGSQLPVFQ